MLDPARPIQIFPAGGAALLLKPDDHVASGGEGAVFRKGGQVYKLYLDPQKALAAGMEEKIRLLSALRHPDVVAPQGPVFGADGGFIGFAMPFCGGTPLVKTFTNTWRDQNGFGQQESATLAEAMRLVVAEVHAMRALMVDGNETNYLFDGLRPKLIDVDSWQIGRFPATAIMMSIRDYSSDTFSALSDWFAWAVVSFQIFTGTHPYKGSHPDFRRGDLEARMRANVSVFDRKVSLPSAVRDLAQIPPGLRGWYEAVFQQGERSVPPAVRPVAGQLPARKLRVLQSGAGALRHELLLALPFDVLHVARNGVAFGRAQGAWQAFDLARRRRLVLTDAEGAAISAGRAALVRCGAMFALVEAEGRQVGGRMVECIPGGAGGPADGFGAAGTVGAVGPVGTVGSVGTVGTGGTVGPAIPARVPAASILRPLPLDAQKVLAFGDSLYAVTDHPERGLVELNLSQFGHQSILAAAKVWPLSVNAARFFNGLALVDMLGTPFALVPCGGALHTLNAGVLRNVAVVDAFARSPAFVAVTGIDKASGQLKRYLLAADGTRLVLRDATACDTADINLVLNPRGIAVGVFEDGVVEVLDTDGFAARTVTGAGIGTGTPLFMVNDMVCYADGNRVMRFSLG